MKIAVFSRWNATCGVSLHAEILVREWVKNGHDVIVFAPIIRDNEIDWHHKKLDVEDEDYVKRVYIEGEENPKFFKVNPEDLREFDVILVESYPFLPHKSIFMTLSKLDRKIPSFMVIHEGSSEELEKGLDLLKFVDKVIVFDFRFIGDVLGRFYNIVRKKIQIISYPAYDRIEEAEKAKRRRKFGEPTLILFSYGRQPKEEYKDYIRVTELLKKDYKLEFEYRIMRSDGLIEEAKKPWIKQWRERPPFNIVFQYLVEADIHLLPKGRTKKAVVSSTVYQSLSSLTPTVAPSTKHFELIPEDDQGVGPVLKYRNVIDLEHRLLRLIEEESYRKAVVEAMKKFVKERRHQLIAKDYIKLFEETIR